MVRLLRNRDFRLLIGGQAVSDLGDGVFLVALAWRVYQSYSTPAALSVVGIAIMLPRVLAIVAGGVLSDRIERRWTMVGADCVRAVTVALLGVVSVVPGNVIVWIVALVALQSMAGSLFAPSESALLPQLVGADELTRANSVRTIVSPIASGVAGPALGGFVTATWGPQAAFWIDAGTFLVSVGTLALMGSYPLAAAVRRSVVADVREGFGYVTGRPWLWGPIATAMVGQVMYAGPNQALVPYLVKFELHASAGALGAVLASAGLGSVAAGVLVGRLPRPRNIVTWMLVGWAIGIGSIAAVGLAQTVWQAALGVFVWSLFTWSGEILWLTLLGLTVPNSIRGRVSSIDVFGSYWLIPLSMALTGPLAAHFGARALLVAAGVGGATAVLSTFLVPGVRRPRFLQQTAAPVDATGAFGATSP
ncbi:MAG TPA: MFS transporter [Candidatus Dormibacteraeota bacterium]